MFTGIVEEIGTVRTLRRGAHSAVLSIDARTVLERTRLGDSIAVNGVCLTVTSLGATQFSADVMHETLRRSNLGALHAGSPVNLERAMAADGRFGGHLVLSLIHISQQQSSCVRQLHEIWQVFLGFRHLLRQEHLDQAQIIPSSQSRPGETPRQS